nr:DNA primase [Lacticaseibacillus brantae]
MAMIPEATVDQILKTVNIADYIGQVVQLHKAGQNLFGLCPFHEEKTPSFSVSESKQIFHCFSCGRGGNVYKFVMDLENVSFPEAVAKVAAFANIPLDVQVTQTVQDAPEVTQQKTILNDVKDLYHHILVNTKTGEAALAYLTERGLSQETIATFELGYAPADNKLVKAFLDNRKIDYQVQRETGLFVENQDGELFDRFVDRIMFPLKNEVGAVVGFSGRVLQKADQQAKYLNSPETTVFNKRDLLFNLDLAKSQFKLADGALLFEGFMDVISAYQAGIKNGIASMGTSLTNEQLQLLAKRTHQLTVCYDGDAPGLAAANRAVDILGEQNRLASGVVVLPNGQDPDEFIKASGAEAFKAQVQKRLTPTAFKLFFLKQGQDLTNDEAKLTYIKASLATVAKLRQPVERAVYLQQIAKDTGINEQTLAQQLPRPQAVVQTSVHMATPQVKFDRYQRAQRELLAFVLHDELVQARLVNNNFVFPDARYQDLFNAWLQYLAANHQPDIATFSDTLEPDQANLLADVSMQNLAPMSDEVIDDLLALLGTVPLRQQLQSLKTQLAQAQQLNDQEAMRSLSQQYFGLLRQLKA